MHCTKCGIDNPDDSGLCRICNTGLVPGKDQKETKLFLDLTRHPFKDVLSTCKGPNPISVAITTVFITILYYFKKLLKKPFYIPFLNGLTPRLRLVGEEEIRGSHKKALNKISSFFIQNGFEPFMALEDTNKMQRIFNHVWVNREKKIYGTALINPAVGRLLYLSFSSITRNKIIVEVNNTHGMPIRYPKNCIVRYLPGYSNDQAFQEILDILHKLGQAPLLLPQKDFLIVHNRLDQMSTRAGIRDGFFHIKEGDGAPKADGTPDSGRGVELRKTPDQTVCFHHPFNLAVRVCSTCNTHLCEACYTERDSRYYCEKHAPGEARSPVLSMARTRLQSEGLEFAGLGVRTLAFFLDAAIIGLLTSALGAAFFFSFRALGLASHVEISIMVSQLFLVGFTIYYFTGHLTRYGQTAGKKLFGLHVVGRRGNPPDATTALVRFAYYFFTCLFFFPIIGYVMILFRKSKQGFHDQLAGTHVVTRHKGKKAVLSWCVLTCLFVGIAWPASMWLPAIFSSLGGPEITLEEKWTFPETSLFGDSISHRIEGNRCIVSSADAFRAIDIPTGSTIWEADHLTDGLMPLFNTRMDGPLLYLGARDNAATTLHRVNSETGEILWKTPVKIVNPMMAADDDFIMVYGETEVHAFDVNGRSLWTRRFSGGSGYLYAFVNQVVIIQKYSESESMDLIALSKETGEILWEDKEAAYNPGQSLGNGYHLFYRNGESVALVHLPEQKVIWENSEVFGSVMVDPTAVGETASVPSRLYTTGSVISGKDGGVLLSFPPGSALACVTEDYLVLISQHNPGDSPPGPGKIMFMDKFSGEVEKTFTGKSWNMLSRIHEDPRTIYLVSSEAPREMDSYEMTSTLMIIEKETFDLKEIPLGTNIVASHADFRIYPEENFLLIPTFTVVGAYILPES